MCFMQTYHENLIKYSMIVVYALFVFLKADCQNARFIKKFQKILIDFEWVYWLFLVDWPVESKKKLTAICQN
jgi:hypothetical protein